MDVIADDIGSLRRQILALKDEAIALAATVATVDEGAAESVLRARNALFEAWTILTTPPDSDDDEDH